MFNEQAPMYADELEIWPEYSKADIIILKERDNFVVNWSLNVPLVY
jgi:hypothetical protein